MKYKVITRFGDFWINAKNKIYAHKKVKKLLRRMYGDDIRIGRIKAYSVDELPTVWKIDLRDDKK